MANVGKAATGALAGAGTGAAIGSAVPVIGTAIGGIAGGLIGGIGGLFGGDDSANENKFSAADIPNPVQQNQLDFAQAQSGTALGKQGQFANALAAQNGIGNQANVFNQMQGLSGQLNERAQGGGPNPALAQLQQTTGQNIAGQAALMASQRGAGANPGLIARQAAMQGGNLQQQSVGQAATLAAQQQIAAQQALQNQQSMMGSLAGNQVNQQAAANNALMSGAQANQNALLGAFGQNQATQASMQGNVNDNKSKVVQQNNANMIGQNNGLLQAGSAALASGLSKLGGPGPSQNQTGGFDLSKSTNAFTGEANGIQHAAQGGQIMPQAGPSSFVGRAMMNQNDGGFVPGKAEVDGDSRKNDNVPAMLSPGEIVIPRSHASDPEKAAAFARRIAMGHGRKK